MDFSTFADPLEIPCSLEQSCEPGSRDGDILLHGWRKGRHTAWDNTIVHPTQHAAYPLDTKNPGRCLTLAEKDKEAKGGVRCTNHGWGFVGAAFSTRGMACPNARHILEAVIRNATYCLKGHAAARAANLLRQEVSLLMAKGVVGQLRNKDRIREKMDTEEDMVWIDEDTN